MKTEPKIEQWMRDAANDYYSPDHHPLATRIRFANRIAARLIRDENKVISIKAGDYALRQRKSA